MLAVIRKTYGYQKTSDTVSGWQLAEMTKVNRADISRTVNELINKNILNEIGDSRISRGKKVKSIGINKEHTEWLTVGKTPTVSANSDNQNTNGHCWQNTNATDGKTPTVTVGKTPHTKEKKERKKIKESGGSENLLLLPDWLSEKLWSDFKLFQVKELDLPVGKIREKTLLAKLIKLKEEGNDHVAVINNAIEHRWKSFFELKRNKNNNSQNNEVDEYSHWRPIGASLNMEPHANERNRDYVQRVKDAKNGAH